MIDLCDETKRLIDKVVLDEYPNEMVGLVLKSGIFVPLTNCHDNPTESFKITEVELAVHLGNIQYIVHSHTKKTTDVLLYDLRTPSAKDYKNQKISGVDWLIFGTEGENVTPPILFPRQPSDVYLKRRFMWYVNDCFSMVSDYYHFELDIDLVDAYDLLDWTDDTSVNTIFRQYEEYGFYDILLLDDIQNGDILILDMERVNSNAHLGVYHNGDVYEQLGLSVKRPIDNYIGRIKRILRYENKSV